MSRAHPSLCVLQYLVHLPLGSLNPISMRFEYISIVICLAQKMSPPPPFFMEKIYRVQISDHDFNDFI